MEPFPEKSCLSVEGLECVRAERVLFSGLNFTLEPGALVQVEGRNGSGKTSLLRILCGLTPASDGAVRWCGDDIARLRSDYLAQLCYVGHASGIKGELTPLENLRMAQALAGSDSGVDGAAALERLQMDTYEDVPTWSLSAGQQRRVALARLLITRASLWILDEPFTALDRSGIKIVEEMLNEHAASGGMTVLTTHHHLTSDARSVTVIDLSA